MKVFLIVFGIVLIGAAAFFLFNGGDSIEIPDELFGRWVTDDDKYADRFFDLSPYDVTFGIGDDRTAEYTIETIRGAIEDNNTIYTITFKDDEGTEYNQSVHFSKSDHDLLMFKNQNGIEWYKQTD